MHLVLGQPLELKCRVSGAPTDEEVQQAHSSYMEALILGEDKTRGRTVGFWTKKGVVVKLTEINREDTQKKKMPRRNGAFLGVGNCSSCILGDFKTPEC